MNNQTATPAIEQVEVRPATINLSANLKIASIPVIVSGRYNIHTNCYYPDSVYLEEDLPTLYQEGEQPDLESFCEKLGYDYSEVHDLIQEAVEKRDQ